MSANSHIEHVGSTSVPGLGGKGFIDIAVSVEKNAIPKTSQEIIGVGYEYQEDAGTKERWYHKRRFTNDNGEESMYHIHLTFFESTDWKELVGFRNFLRENPEVKERYAIAKQKAVLLASGEREKYVEAKDPVIEEILAQVRARKL